jgi:hypothetical protein
MAAIACREPPPPPSTATQEKSMQLPSTVHPRHINLNGYTFEVVTYFPITDEQALKIAVNYLRFAAKKQLRKKGVHQILFAHDAHSLALL